ncbi:hypothetical protein BJX65DRAFT_274006 [Aspergillus insuetus]
MIALLLLAPVLAGKTIAADAPFSILKRHHDSDSNAFIPGTTPGCPADWPMCGDSGICYNPDEGQTCCPGGTDACPSSSYCFLEPYCCPDSMDAKACAHEYGLALTTSYLSNPTHSINPDLPPPPPPTLPPSTSSASSITIRSTPIPTPASSDIAPWPSISLGPTTTSAGEEEPEYTGVAAGLSSRGAKEVVALGAIVFGLMGHFL